MDNPPEEESTDQGAAGVVADVGQMFRSDQEADEIDDEIPADDE